MDNSEILKIRGDVKIVELSNKKQDLRSISLNNCKNKLYIVSNDFDSWSLIRKECHRFIFRSIELKYNILDNDKVVPIPIVVNELPEEYQEFSKLPVVLSYDPVIRRMNISVGSILKMDNKYYVVE